MFTNTVTKRITNVDCCNTGIVYFIYKLVALGFGKSIAPI